MRRSLALALLAAIAGLLTGAGTAVGSTFDERAAGRAATAFLAAIRTERGSRICALVTPATQRAFIAQARSDGLRVSRCAPAAAHIFHRLGRVLGRFRVIDVDVSGRSAYATINDAPISDSGNDALVLVRSRCGRWLVDET